VRNLLIDEEQVGLTGNIFLNPDGVVVVGGKIHYDDDTALTVHGLQNTDYSDRLTYDHTKGLIGWVPRPPLGGSSLRYKKDIADLKDDFFTILKVSPKSFVYKDGGAKDIGYIAEDFDKLGLKKLVGYDKDGRADTIKYNKIPLYVLEVVKGQQKKIEGLEARVKALESIKK
jgi:hypothetical protein